VHFLFLPLSETGGAPDVKVLVVGMGNPDRGDDGVGPLVVRQLAACVPPGVAIVERTGDALALIDEWAGRDAVILVDAAALVSCPGRVHRVDLLEQQLPTGISLSSTHAFGVADAVGLACALGLQPRRLIAYAIEGGNFDPGASISTEVAASVSEVVARVRDEISLLV
jgi:hydrogenase maturation protease